VERAVTSSVIIHLKKRGLRPYRHLWQSGGLPKNSLRWTWHGGNGKKEEEAEEEDAHSNGRNIFESIMKDGVECGDSKNRPLWEVKNMQGKREEAEARTALRNCNVVCHYCSGDRGTVKHLIQRSRLSLEESTVTGTGKQFPAFHETRRFITAFTTAWYWSLFWGWRIHVTPLGHVPLT